MTRTLIVTVLGLGKLRPAPGTWGSLPPCVFATICLLLGAPTWLLQGLLALTAAWASWMCVRLGRWAERRFRGKDPGVVVIDEVAGMAFALLFVPTSFSAVVGSGSSASSLADTPDRIVPGLICVGAAFLLFRIFDIIKVPPANLMQQFPYGWGILLDDVVAGIYANLILQISLRFVLPVLVYST